MWPSHKRVSVKGKGRRRRIIRTYIRSISSGVAIFSTIVPSVLSERRTSRRRTRQKHMLR